MDRAIAKARNINFLESNHPKGVNLRSKSDCIATLCMRVERGQSDKLETNPPKRPHREPYSYHHGSANYKVKHLA